MFVPLEPVDLPIGITLEITVSPVAQPPGDEFPPGSAAGILHALARSPPLSQEAGAEFERVLAEAKVTAHPRPLVAKAV